MDRLEINDGLKHIPTGDKSPVQPFNSTSDPRFIFFFLCYNCMNLLKLLLETQFPRLRSVLVIGQEKRVNDAELRYSPAL